MSQPKSIKAYTDCEKQFELAAASERGIAITFESRGEATRFMQKMNMYRVLLRKQSRQVYEVTDPKYGISPFDHFQLTKDKENDCRVMIKPYNLDVVKVEKL
jgi:prolyl oligopeptidase PreP (S9A serine peptidase family)